ncbi:DUF3291 domain-containing protein [Parvularcula sp. ZS-1/3]|uniref:DUF3291 domain-containing protein n=1 Tax=Parvularcula mediterranea TaxID=2732508 RepID=A0A7Y3W5F8_9PROT|nr:DUF3291 domain-containing protein [Parvularcula mediterranea]NNU16463.1 DUF3291 domain-containing protein [Parvularcula mediterranea]
MQQPSGTHLAQINIARGFAAVDSPEMKGFAERIDAVNAIAERSEGFVWRFTGETGQATDVRFTNDPRDLLNISVWETPKHLADFVFNTAHRKVYARKAEWFEAPKGPTFAMWWIKAGEIPTPGEALDRLEHLRAHGSSPEAFTWADLPEAKAILERRCA